MSKVFDQLISVRDLEPGFLRPRYEECFDPYILPDVEPAVARIRRAVERNEKVLIYGDYDVDGVTASTALREALRIAGIKTAEIMLPNRFTDGYGMSERIFVRAEELGVTLVMTVDCGSHNQEIIAKLREKNIDVIVTDHHECDDELPDAVAVINPKRRDYSSSESSSAETAVLDSLRQLAGVGVVFKLAQALVKAGLIPEGQEKWLLDLVLIGTICDSMQLRGENRRLCYYGFKVLEKTRRPGLKELMLSAGVKRLDSDAVGFQLGPRLNAAGRMETAERALELLTAERRPQAALLAAELERLNQARRQQQSSALKEIRDRGVRTEPVIVECGDWHEGILGIIAGRLVEQYHRPAIVLSETEGVLKGSGRSFGEFNLATALSVCQEQIIGGGGHAEACGLKLAKDKLIVFRQAINDYYTSLNLKNQERFFGVQEDLAVRDFTDLSLELLEELRQLEPYGEGNPEPVFLLPEVRVVEASRLGSDKEHLRLLVWDQNGERMKLMCFHAPEEYLRLRGGETVNVWITLNENDFRGLRSVEGRIVKLAVL